MKKQYKVGDKVTIRSWESMEKEFGVDERGGIPCGSIYFSHIRELSRDEFDGRAFTVESVDGDRILLKNIGWNWSPEMFTDWEEKEEHIIPLKPIKVKDYTPDTIVICKHSSCPDFCYDCEQEKEQKIKELREFLEKIMPNDFVERMLTNFPAVLTGYTMFRNEIYQNANKFYNTL